MSLNLITSTSFFVIWLHNPDCMREHLPPRVLQLVERMIWITVRRAETQELVVLLPCSLPALRAAVHHLKRRTHISPFRESASQKHISRLSGLNYLIILGGFAQVLLKQNNRTPIQFPMRKHAFYIPTFKVHTGYFAGHHNLRSPLCFLSCTLKTQWNYFSANNVIGQSYGQLKQKD